jgi:phosphoribosyl 1,2-cyclic phosphodiesterase
MQGFCPLASGSSGNCVFLSSKNTKVLIDAGISTKQILLRLETLKVDISQIDAILITHEHMDHIEGLKVLTGRYNIPVIANSETAKQICSNLYIKPKFMIFTSNEEFTFKDLTVFPFSIQHDTLDPVGFLIKTNELKLGFCTDIGFVTSLVKKHLAKCDYLYLEANHNIDMVHACNRPINHKQRVLGRCGHLSNEESLYLLESIIHDKLKHVYLAHLSAECNGEDVVKRVFGEFFKKQKTKIKLSIASRSKISDPILF